MSKGTSIIYHNPNAQIIRLKLFLLLTAPPQAIYFREKILV